MLENALSFSDRVLVLDDRSTDDSAKLAEQMGCDVKQRSILKDAAWGRETPARAELWQWGAEAAGDGWLLIQDADMLMVGNPRDLTWTWDCSIWAFVLWDCWDSEQQARVDGPWRHGPITPRPWMFRPSICVSGAPQWSGRGLHSGHAPTNLSGVAGVAPPDAYHWLHLAYVTKEDRVKKHAQYLAHAPLLSEFERMHAMSISDA